MLIHVLGRNVDHILPNAVEELLLYGTKQTSRNGDVRSYAGTFITEVTCPQERVLFNPWRKINPFLHLIDGLSILSRVDSVVPLMDTVNRFRQFSDDGETLRGHYGKRLAHQLGLAIQMLLEQPDSRRVVLSIWEAQKDLGTESRDIPCNLMAVPRLVDGKLNLTVFNRSNDLFWGMLGANIVQFSFLQEYLAASLKVGMGTLTQISTNAHIYTGFGPGKDISGLTKTVSDEYLTGTVRPMDLVGLHHPSVIEDANTLMRLLAAREPLKPNVFFSAFFQLVVEPMVTAHREHRKGDTQAVDILPSNSNNDWIVAGRRWFQHRA